MQGSELPEIKAIIATDSEGERLAAKFFSKVDFPDKLSQQEFERKLFKKTKGVGKAEGEIVVLDGLTCVYKGGPDVCLAVIGSETENELILLEVLESLSYALINLLRLPSGLDKKALQTNLELLLLAIDEAVDGGIILELDAATIESRVMLRGAVPESLSSYKEMTVGAVLDKMKDKAAKQFSK